MSSFERKVSPFAVGSEMIERLGESCQLDTQECRRL
jgi:hypothetical protein